ncbi:MAG: dTDP-4-dehydrorhamnose 3,5-epimerase [Litorilinea sp.]|nr:MAG: dTDP-4-dehydrorhamnose 3,5-epimerase [Litorilinea sp.]
MVEIVESDQIAGVKFVRLRAYSDERGRFMETFRKEWFPERSWEIVQCNRSDSEAGVLRGLHYHHRQVDYWHVTQGQIRVGLADLRVGSPTFGAVETVEVDAARPMGIFIPSGVAHGFLTLSPATLTYVVDNYYDGQDEKGVAWNDPTLGIPWGVQEPLLSPRDRQNPLLADIPRQALPVWTH